MMLVMFDMEMLKQVFGEAEIKHSEQWNWQQKVTISKNMQETCFISDTALVGLVTLTRPTHETAPTFRGRSGGYEAVRGWWHDAQGETTVDALKGLYI